MGLIFSRRSLLCRGALLLAASTALAGCQSPRAGGARVTGGGDAGEDVSADAGGQAAPVAPITNTDECATRLHDLCEPLLLFYLTRHHLPDRLEELRQLPGFETGLDFTCPVSKKPYVYNPVGIQTGDDQPRIILYDPAPSHSGMRWAVAIVEPQNNKAPFTKVVAVPEGRFTLKLPG